LRDERATTGTEIVREVVLLRRVVLGGAIVMKSFARPSRAPTN